MRVANQYRSIHSLHACVRGDTPSPLQSPKGSNLALLLLHCSTSLCRTECSGCSRRFTRGQKPTPAKWCVYYVYVGILVGARARSLCISGLLSASLGLAVELSISRVDGDESVVTTDWFHPPRFWSKRCGANPMSLIPSISPPPPSPRGPDKLPYRAQGNGVLGLCRPRPPPTADTTLGGRTIPEKPPPPPCLRCWPAATLRHRRKTSNDEARLPPAAGWASSAGLLLGGRGGDNRQEGLLTPGWGVVVACLR